MPQTLHHNPPSDMVKILAEIFETEDMSAHQLLWQIKVANRVLNHVFGALHKGEDKLSHARLRLLIRLEINSRAGCQEGLLPSELSRWLGVSRNTVSSLLNGLEEQGLITRQLHPTDRRQILIQLTERGHQLIQERAPQTAKYVTHLFASLTSDEQNTLNNLLTKFLDGIIQQANELEIELPDSLLSEHPINE